MNSRSQQNHEGKAITELFAPVDRVRVMPHDNSATSKLPGCLAQPGSVIYPTLPL